MTRNCDFSNDLMTCPRCGKRSFSKRARSNCAADPGYAALAGKLRGLEEPTDSPQLPAPSAGPGTELKKLLKLVGITASPTCSCNTRARTMDTNGVEWCEANIDTIVGWLREEATKRKLPFVDMAGRLLVRRAIRNARKAAS
jgi:hypothetical protein